MVLFGKYLKYVIRSKDPPKPVSCEVEKTPDAFQLLMNVQLTIQVPAKVTEHTSKDRMKNRLIQVLKEKELGWSADCVKTTGVKFVELMTDVLWHVDGQGKTQSHNSLPVFRVIWLQQTRKSWAQAHTYMEVSKLRTYSMNLFSISQEPWMIKAKWSETNQAVKDLASNLSLYCDYLDQQ